MLRDCLFLILGYLKTIVFGIGTIINGQRAIIDLLKHSVPHARHTVRAKSAKRSRDEISQACAARDFGVSRSTIYRWEKNQTVDGPANTSNEIGYYRSLRTNPELRGAYQELANSYRAYRDAQKRAALRGQRFVRFVHYREEWLKHNLQYGINYASVNQKRYRTNMQYPVLIQTGR